MQLSAETKISETMKTLFSPMHYIPPFWFPWTPTTEQQVSHQLFALAILYYTNTDIEAIHFFSSLIICFS